MLLICAFDQVLGISRLLALGERVRLEFLRFGHRAKHHIHADGRSPPWPMDRGCASQDKPSMLRHIQRDRQEDVSGLVGDFQLPAAPLDVLVLAFLPQFLNGFNGLIMGCFQVRDFNPNLVDDPFVRVHKMKVTVHAGATSEIFTQSSGLAMTRNLPLDEQLPCHDAR